MLLLFFDEIYDFGPLGPGRVRASESFKKKHFKRIYMFVLNEILWWFHEFLFFWKKLCELFMTKYDLFMNSNG